jgi:hypothetical protein
LAGCDPRWRLSWQLLLLLFVLEVPRSVLANWLARCLSYVKGADATLGYHLLPGYLVPA